MDLVNVLRKAKDFHGHICPFLALGVKISEMAMEELNVKREAIGSITEDFLVVVECNNCLVDGIQIATGCTLGNNSLIYLDLGKNAATFVKRKDWEGIRIYVDSEKIRSKYFDERAVKLFNKVVVKREGKEEEIRELSKLWEEIGFKMLEIPKEDFKIEKVKVEPIERAPIFESLRCKKCGELAMVTRLKDGLCLKCSGSYYAVVGRGIVKFENSKMSEVR